MSKAKWNLMVYMNAKNDLDPFGVANFTEMAEVGSTADVNILVEFGRKDRTGWEKPLRFRVTKGMAPAPENAAEKSSNTNMGDAASLVSFADWAMGKYPAERNMLVVWDHGQGWRRRLLEEASSGETARAAPAARIAERAPYRSISWDDEFKTHMRNREIQDGLEKLVTKRGKLDIIGFDACLMAMIETAFAMRKTASFMVASEEVEPGPGWDYAALLAPLVKNPDSFDAKKFGGHAVDVAFKRLDTCSLLDLAHAEPAAKAVSDYAEQLCNYMPMMRKRIEDARARCKEFGISRARPHHGVNSIDLYQFLRELDLPFSLDHPLVVAQQKAALLVRTLRVSHHASADYRRPENVGGLTRWFDLAGIAIYFPASKAEFDRDVVAFEGGYRRNVKSPVEFIQEYAWVTFLEKYLAEKH